MTSEAPNHTFNATDSTLTHFQTNNVYLLLTKEMAGCNKDHLMILMPHI